jgi:hypothetical protein
MALDSEISAIMPPQSDNTAAPTAEEISAFDSVIFVIWPSFPNAIIARTFILITQEYDLSYGT